MFSVIKLDFWMTQTGFISCAKQVVSFIHVCKFALSFFIRLLRFQLHFGDIENETFSVSSGRQSIESEACCSFSLLLCLTELCLSLFFLFCRSPAHKTSTRAHPSVLSSLFILPFQFANFNFHSFFQGQISSSIVFLLVLSTEMSIRLHKLGCWSLENTTASIYSNSFNLDMSI